MFTNSFGYKIEYNDRDCVRNSTAPSDLNITFQHRGYSNNRNFRKRVLTLMQEAVNRNGSEYMFSLLYADQNEGFVVHQINGAFSDDSCMWSAYIDDGEEPLASRGLLNCRVKAGQTLSFRYERVDNADGSEDVITQTIF